MFRRRIGRAQVVAVICVGLAHGYPYRVSAQTIEIGIVDLYGLNRVSEERVRDALISKVGDTLSRAQGRPAVLTESEDRLAALPEVARARIEVICCEQGRAIVYVGVEERGGQIMRFRSAPAGGVRLQPDIVRAAEEFWVAYRRAIEQGNEEEDWSQGHAFSHDPATRAVQERFEMFAGRDLRQLRVVLRTSADAEHRALAALVLGYVRDKQAVVEDLVHAMGDPDDDVRNNAMRALLVFADKKPVAPRIPTQPFISFLSSPVWGDRNKASGALMTLTAGRDPLVMAQLRKSALTSLVEMARWTSAGHAIPALILLGRLSGYSDESAEELFNRGDREQVIRAAIDKPLPISPAR